MGFSTIVWRENTFLIEHLARKFQIKFYLHVRKISMIYKGRLITFVKLKLYSMRYFHLHSGKMMILFFYDDTNSLGKLYYWKFDTIIWSLGYQGGVIFSEYNLYNANMLITHRGTNFQTNSNLFPSTSKFLNQKLNMPGIEYHTTWE